MCAKGLEQGLGHDDNSFSVSQYQEEEEEYCFD